MTTDARTLPDGQAPFIAAVAADIERQIPGAGFAFREIEARDEQFLRRLYAASRPDAHFLAHWPREQQDEFFNSQFQHQDIHYRSVYLKADFLLIERHGVPAGRLILHRGRDDWRIIDVALVPELRRKGLGGALMRTLQDLAAAAGAMVSLHVENDNIARNFYDRLGFTVDEDLGAHIRMVWRRVS